MKLLERGIWCVLFLIESTYNFLTNKLPTYIPTSDIKKQAFFTLLFFDYQPKPISTGSWWQQARVRDLVDLNILLKKKLAQSFGSILNSPSMSPVKLPFFPFYIKHGLRKKHLKKKYRKVFALRSNFSMKVREREINWGWAERRKNERTSQTFLFVYFREKNMSSQYSFIKCAHNFQRSLI